MSNNFPHNFRAPGARVIPQMQEQPSYQVEVATRMFMSVLDEGSGVLKLYFTLSTGAVVLFVNLLATSHARRLVLIPLALSICWFGLAAAFCLRLLLALVNFRLLMTNALTTGASVSELKTSLDAWSSNARKQRKRMELLFWAGMAFTVIFVVAVVAVR